MLEQVSQANHFTGSFLGHAVSNADDAPVWTRTVTWTDVSTIRTQSRDVHWWYRQLPCGNRRAGPAERFELVREVLPDLVKPLQSQLRRIGHPAIAAQVRELRIFGRCPCESFSCGHFIACRLTSSKDCPVIVAT